MVVNFVVDQATFEDEIIRTHGGADGEASRSRPWSSSSVSVSDGDPLRRRSETVNGTLVHPAEILAAALIGHVRRVVYDSAGTVIDLGRKRRLFTGAAREAVMLQSARCMWPGCDVAAGRCQADHLEPWSTTGSTAPRTRLSGLRTP